MQQTPETMQNMSADPKRTKMVAPMEKKKAKLYKVEIQRDVEVMFPDGSKKICVPGEVVEVEESMARLLLTTKLQGTYKHSGESDSRDRHVLVYGKPFKGEKKMTKEEAEQADLDSLYQDPS
jgi:hypothetical protein